MELRPLVLLCLLLRLSSSSADQSDARRLPHVPRPGRAVHVCSFNEKELHTTVRSAASSALKGLCSPVEMEARLTAMEQRLNDKMEEMKSLSLLLLENFGYEYDDEESGEPERHRYYGGGGSVTDDAELKHYNQFRSDGRHDASSAHRTSYKRYNAARGSTAAARGSTTAARGSTIAARGSTTVVANGGLSSQATGAYSGQSQAASSRSAAAQNAISRHLSVRGASAGSSSSRTSSADSTSADQQTRDSSAVYSGAQRTSGAVDNGVQQSHRRSGHRYDQAAHLGAAEQKRYGAAAQRASSPSFQYTTHNSSESLSGTRQVSAASLGSRSDFSSGRGNTVRYSASYTPFQSAGAYANFGSQHVQSRKTKGRRQSRRQQARRRAQHVTDTVSYVSGSESAQRSRFREINNFNDTVYEHNGTRMYSYYWEVKNFDTMMNTWEDRHSLRSPNFYIYQGGYRMYIRVFPSRQGGNVYLHTGLTPGRYDSRLPWPFRLRLRLSLLDHSAPTSDIRSRVWNPRHLCSGWNWRRPKRKDNFECVGLGFPQQLVRSRRFLLDGAVLIKLDVFLEE